MKGRRVNVWIYEQNLEKWDAVENKSKWVNALLSMSDDTSEYGRSSETPVGPTITALKEVVPSPINIGAEKPCCTKGSPCVHWSFDGANEVWTNALSGRKRAA